MGVWLAERIASKLDVFPVRSPDPWKGRDKSVHPFIPRARSAPLLRLGLLQALGLGGIGHYGADIPERTPRTNLIAQACVCCQRAVRVLVGKQSRGKGREDRRGIGVRVGVSEKLCSELGVRSEPSGTEGTADAGSWAQRLREQSGRGDAASDRCIRGQDNNCPCACILWAGVSRGRDQFLPTQAGPC